MDAGLPLCGTTDAILAMKTAVEVAAGDPGMLASKTCTNTTTTGVIWQTVIHAAFILSAVGIAYTDRIMNASSAKPKPAH